MKTCWPPVFQRFARAPSNNEEHESALIVTREFCQSELAVITILAFSAKLASLAVQEFDLAFSLDEKNSIADNRSVGSSPSELTG